jgi:hypothetical protein
MLGFRKKVCVLMSTNFWLHGSLLNSFMNIVVLSKGFVFMFYVSQICHLLCVYMLYMSFLSTSFLLHGSLFKSFMNIVVTDDGGVVFMFYVDHA